MNRPKFALFSPTKGTEYQSMYLSPIACTRRTCAAMSGKFRPAAQSPQRRYPPQARLPSGRSICQPSSTITVFIPIFAASAHSSSTRSALTS